MSGCHAAINCVPWLRDGFVAADNRSGCISSSWHVPSLSASKGLPDMLGLICQQLFMKFS
jgi:hypothetical protein